MGSAVTGDGLLLGDDGLARCWWCAGDPLYRLYHDREWGFPSRDDRHLFEKLCLEGFQAGLSWLTILRKREHFRRAFRDFEIQAVARFNRRSVDRLLEDRRIVRNRAKIESAINNARRALEVAEEFGSLAAYCWRFAPEDRRPWPITWQFLSSQASTDESAAMSRDLRRRGWTFVGPVTTYAFMQAVGLVNDHLHGCAIQELVEEAREAFARPF